MGTLGMSASLVPLVHGRTTMAIRIRIYPQPNSVGAQRVKARKHQQALVQQQLQLVRLQNLRFQQQLQLQQLYSGQQMYGGQQFNNGAGVFGYGTGINAGYGYGYPAGQSPAQMCPPGQSPMQIAPSYPYPVSSASSVWEGAMLTPGMSPYGGYPSSSFAQASFGAMPGGAWADSSYGW